MTNLDFQKQFTQKSIEFSNFLRFFILNSLFLKD